MTALSDPAASRALLIGVHGYETLDELPAVERNLIGLKRAFTDEALWGLPDAHCVTLPQPESAQAVLDTLHSVALQTTDTLVVYYAGHGLTDPFSDELYLALPGSDGNRMYSALPYEWVRRAMLDPHIKARRKVVILDCCFSGRALLGGMSGTDQVADRALIEGTCLMAASAETRKALSPPGEEFTAFTGELITVLGEGIADGPPLLDMHTLFRHLHTTLAAKGRPLPQQRNRNTGGLIALARNRGYAPVAPETVPHKAPAPPAPEPPTSEAEEPAEAKEPTEAEEPAEVEQPAETDEPAETDQPVETAEPSQATDSPEPTGAPQLPESPGPSSAPHQAHPPQPAKTPQHTRPRPVVHPAPPQQDSLRRATTNPTAVSPTQPTRTGSPRLKIGVASLAVLLAAGIPAIISWLPDGPGGPGGGSKASYNAATKDVVNKSEITGDTLKFIGQDADSWDPQRSYYGYVWNFARYYTRQLVTYTAKPAAAGTKLTPDLATSRAKISNGRKTYTYTLRKGVTWEDGSPITSQDIKYGIERLWAQEVIPGGPTHLREALDPNHTYEGPYKDKSADKLGLKAIKTPDRTTIQFHLPKPNAEFEQLLAMPAASPVKRVKDTKTKYGLDPFSSGPYAFRSYAPNKSLQLVRNSHWKRPSDPIRKALPDTITVDFYTNETAGEAALTAGKYDLMLGGQGLNRQTQTKALQSADHKKNLDNPLTGGVRYVAFPRTVAPMDNVHCRRAVFYAADHNALQTTLGGPTAGDVAPNMLPPHLKGSDATYDPYGVRQNSGRPDVRKAQDELKACGRRNGFSTKIAVRNTAPEEVDAATSLQESLKKAGIRTEIDQFDGENATTVTGSPNVVKKSGYGIVLGRWSADFPTAQTFWQPLVGSKFILPSGNYNVTQVNDRAIDKALDEAVGSDGSAGTTGVDPEKAGTFYEQVNHAVAKGAYYLPLLYDRNVTWRSPRLANVYTSDAYGDYDFASLGVKSKEH
ncbi:ABC transporter substrate-binding protein [Streptomyces sp. NPDC017993]|uniref:caspase, EACC1-associated type n=1 Tax=Streptomyces sp. NPDC017993 TaxID=3365027 RepID=UPI00379F1999